MENQKINEISWLTATFTIIVSVSYFIIVIETNEWRNIEEQILAKSTVGIDFIIVLVLSMIIKVLDWSLGLYNQTYFHLFFKISFLLCSTVIFITYST